MLNYSCVIVLFNNRTVFGFFSDFFAEKMLFFAVRRNTKCNTETQ